MKYVSYIRVSTKKQGKSGLGLESQQEILNHYLGTDNVKTFIEIESGGNTERPELKKAIELCKKNNYGLAVAKLDRLSRNTEFALKVFSELDEFLFSCDIPQQKGSKMDKFILTIISAIADREKELIGIRTKAALKRKVERDGQWRVGNKDFKEVLKQGNKARTEKALNRGNNKRVFDAITMFLEKGFGWSEIARKLNESENKTAYHNETIKGKTKQTKGFQAVQVQRIFNKFNKDTELLNRAKEAQLKKKAIDKAEKNV